MAECSCLRLKPTRVLLSKLPVLQAAICCVSMVLASTSVQAGEATLVNQDAWTNLAIVVVGRGQEESRLTVMQTGIVNGFASAQLSGNNYLQSTQSGFDNSYIALQVLSGEHPDPDTGVSTNFALTRQQAPSSDVLSPRVDLDVEVVSEQTEDGYLTYFASGGFSMMSITETGRNITSRFGRLR
jgi:hypothetical protein